MQTNIHKHGNDHSKNGDNEQEKGSNRCKVWLQQALYDLDAANLSLNNGFNEWAAYQSEQAAEKALKAVIVHAGWRAPKMHKLGVLFGMCNQANDQFRQSKFYFRHLESFTFISRYPFLIPGKDKTPHEQISEKESIEALNESTEIVIKIRDILSNSKCSKSTVFHNEVEYGTEEIQHRIEEVKNILVREFQPEKIVLFGRFAREYSHPISGTMDILIVADSKLSFIERIVKAREATKGGIIIIEPLIYTPEEFELMTGNDSEGFIESAMEEGKMIYDKGYVAK